MVVELSNIVLNSVVDGGLHSFKVEFGDLFGQSVELGNLFEELWVIRVHLYEVGVVHIMAVRLWDVVSLEEFVVAELLTDALRLLLLQSHLFQVLQVLFEAGDAVFVVFWKTIKLVCGVELCKLDRLARVS